MQTRRSSSLVLAVAVCHVAMSNTSAHLQNLLSTKEERKRREDRRGPPCRRGELEAVRNQLLVQVRVEGHRALEAPAEGLPRAVRQAVGPRHHGERAALPACRVEEIIIMAWSASFVGIQFMW